MNKLIRSIEKDGVGYGMFMAIKDPAMVEIIGHAGYDFAIIDLEHSALDLSTMEHMIRAAKIVDITSIVRVPQGDYATVLRAVEAGADAVMFPHLITKDQAEKIVNTAKYYPIGNRGLDASTRVAKYGNIPMAEHMEQQNKRVQVIGMIEDKEALEHIDDILTVEGLDLLFIGAADLSSSFGIPGQVSHPMLRDAIKMVIKKANESGVHIGLPAYDAVQAKELENMGVKFIATPAVDTFHITETLKNHLAKVKEYKK
ncbi:HpcH/HpaI aldolase family protein [Metabacillus arenae]|uniref:Aldolase n=1 Tax=Metabacillus arenae TaxID=2771434 RepID=A0A926NF54_9BACI|nr:aldolase/citrate lyase family protein [Metabacillus arenae]MBD1383122.1 aldolase [Metabacillus arenae]